MKKAILLTCITLLTLGSIGSGRSFAETSNVEKQKAKSAYEKVPAEAREVFEYVLKTGKTPKGYVGGRTWQNREKRLPKGGDYREYDVHPKVQGRNRGAERIVIDFKSMKGWYTADHYQTFIPIRR
jgi:ribonuclease T1